MIDVANAVRERDGWRCQLCGRPSETPEGLPVVTAPGTVVDEHAVAAEGADLAEQTDGMVSICQACLRDKLQRNWRVVRFSYAAGEFELIDASSHRVPHEAIWFYTYQPLRPVDILVDVLRKLVEQIRELEVGVAAGLAELRAALLVPELRAALGYSSWADAVQALGLELAHARWLVAQGWRERAGTAHSDVAVSPEVTEAAVS
ncbi:MAG: hypothetical protein ACK4K6_18965, partial [Pseudarthrobacter sp.]